MFWKKKPTISDPQFGLLTFSHSSWTSGPLQCPAGEVFISIDGDQSSPSVEGIAFAREVFENPADFVSAATAFIRADANAVAFMEYNGELDLSGFSFEATPGTFTVDFGLTDWPDAMLNVLFADGVPFEVWLGD
jgi:hypothetical protein